jgi:predicted nicotinamide N-methyase
VLELGSGTGVSGIATHFLGAQLTVLTDLEYVIDNLRKSVNLNVGENTSSHDTASSIHVRTLDWCDINTYIFPNEFTCQNISEFVGDDNSERGTTIDNYDTRSMDQGEISTTTQWDIIIGADIIWLEHLVEPLVKVLSHLCTTSHTVIYLAHQVSIVYY